MRESDFQTDLIKEIRQRFPGCIVVKNDPNYLQGWPDLTVYIGQYFFLLECKISAHAPHQPNQDYYVNATNANGGFARFIYPENKEEVLNEIQQTFGSRS